MKGEQFKDDHRGANSRANGSRALPKALVLELTGRSAWRATLAVLEDFAVLALAIGAALYWWPNPLVLLAAILVIGSRQHALFIIAHDAAHYLLFESRNTNDAVGRLCATIQGLSMCSYRVIHRMHHNNLYGELDPDTALHGGYPRGRAYLVKKLLKDLTGQTAWKTYAYFLFAAPALNTATNRAIRPLDDTSERLRVEARSDRNWVIVFHVAALAVAAWSGYLVQYLVLWVLPLVTVVQAILRLRAIAEHGATTDFSSPLTAARTNLGPAWLRWVLFPHHVNFHIEHHLYASVPMYNLPRLHEEMKRHGVLDGAEVVPFPVTLGKIFAERAAVTT